MPLVGKKFVLAITFNVFPINISNHIEQLMQWLDLMNCRIWHGNQQVFHTIKMRGLILIQQHISMS
jgi:hypothetical protein